MEPRAFLCLAIITGCSSSTSTPQTPSVDAATSASPDGASDAGPQEASVDQTKLGAACSRDVRCETGTCYRFAMIDDKLTEPRCVDGDPCALVTCPSGRHCAVLLNIPGDVTCDP